MAAHLAKALQASPRRRRRARGRRGPIADINMTPFIDVMLVLLIVFMIAAPLLATGVPIDLPQTTAGPINIEKKPITVSIDEKGVVYLDDKVVTPAALVASLRDTAKAGPDERIYVRAHRRVDYGRVAEIMTVMTNAGFKRVALVTEPADGR